MSVTDPIADALTIIRNASRARKESAEVKASKLLGQILEIFKKERFIQDFRFVDDKKQGFYKVYLRYQKGNIPAITGIRKMSVPGLRRYVTKTKVPKVYGGLGVAIVTTSRGVFTDEEARALNVGGELLCQIW